MYLESEDERKMKKLAKYTSIFFGIVGLLITGMIIVVGNRMDYAFKNTKITLPNGVLFGIGVVSCVCFLLVTNRMRKNFDRFSIKRMLVILSCVFFVVEFFISYEIFFKTGWDAGILNDASDYMVLHPGENLYSSYYVEYPNNVLLLFIITVIKRISGLFGQSGYGCVLFLCVSINNLAVLFTSLFIYNVTKSRYWAVITWLVAAIWFGISPWMCIAYSDTFSILLPILTLYIYSVVRNKNCSLGKKVGAISIVPIIGYFIKPQCSIILIAIFLIELIQLNRKKIKYLWTSKRKVIYAIIQVGFMVGLLVGSAHLYTITPIKPNCQKGLTHFLMMGLNEETSGTFSQKDSDFTQSFPTKQEKKDANIREIKGRINDMMGKRLAVHIIKKTLVNFNDGTFAWGGEDGAKFYKEGMDDKKNASAVLLKNIFYNHGKYYSIFSNMEQMIWLVLLFFVSISLFQEEKLTGSSISYIVLFSIVGICMFNMLFEARARYLYCYAPFFVSASILAVRYIWKKVSKKSVIA